MYLSRFGVKNYKCLGEIDIPLTPVHVLIGENDSGKTSLLEAMDAFFASSEKPLAGIFPQPWSARARASFKSPTTDRPLGRMGRTGRRRTNAKLRATRIRSFARLCSAGATLLDSREVDREPTAENTSFAARHSPVTTRRSLPKC